MNKLYKKILESEFIPEFIGKFVVILINWIFQSLLYMEKTERSLKLFIDLIFFIGFFFIFYRIFGFIASVIISFIIAHTLNWIFNGHIFALLKTFGNIKTEPEKFISYLDELNIRSSNESSIILVVTFGSLARDDLKETSDIDIRIIRKSGLLNAIRSSIFILIERFTSFFNRFPIDIYLCENVNCIKKMKENPIPVYDPDNLIKSKI